MFSTHWYLHHAQALQWHNVPPYQAPTLTTGAVIPGDPFLTPVLAIEAHTYEVDAFSREMLEKRMQLVELMDQNKQSKEEVDHDSDRLICSEGPVSSAATVDIEMVEHVFTVQGERDVDMDDTFSTELSHLRASPTSPSPHTHHCQPLHPIFRTLPVELVLEIGKHAVVNSPYIELWNPSSFRHTNMLAVLAQPAMTRVSKEFRKTLLPVFYEQNGFIVLDDGLDMTVVSEWLRNIGSVNRSRLRGLCFVSECDDIFRMMDVMDFGHGLRTSARLPAPETVPWVGLHLQFAVAQPIDMAEFAAESRRKGARFERAISV